MVDTAVSVTTLTANAVSADVITTAEGGTAVTSGNVAVIDVGNEARDVIISFYAASAATATIQAGDKPPAERSGLGNTSALTLPAGDLLLMAVEGGRFMQDNGTIRITIGSNTVVVGAHRIPKTV
jgi:hypothetical protein